MSIAGISMRMEDLRLFPTSAPVRQDALAKMIPGEHDGRRVPKQELAMLRETLCSTSS
jgi:hypothetical protein